MKRSGFRINLTGRAIGVAMMLTSHITRPIFDRYNTTVMDLTNVAVKLGSFPRLKATVKNTPHPKLALLDASDGTCLKWYA